MTQIWIAIVLLAADIVGLAVLVRQRASWKAFRGRWLAWLAAIVGAAAASFVEYPYSERYTAIGYPVPGAAFEISTGQDFVSLLTIPILCLDAALVGIFPVTCVIVFVVLRARKPS